jgi:hypothetical protein
MTGNPSHERTPTEDGELRGGPLPVPARTSYPRLVTRSPGARWRGYRGGSTQRQSTTAMIDVSPLALLLALAVALAACGTGAAPTPDGIVPDAATVPEADALDGPAPPARTPAASAFGDLPVVTVYKSPSCVCCGRWVEHMRESGFAVEVEDRVDVTPVKDEHGVPTNLRSCHTAVVGGYFVEGHVPADDVRRLLAERPDANGIALGGMPASAPGMGHPGAASEPYEVYLVSGTGRTLFTRH